MARFRVELVETHTIGGVHVDDTTDPNLLGALGEKLFLESTAPRYCAGMLCVEEFTSLRLVSYSRPDFSSGFEPFVPSSYPRVCRLEGGRLEILYDHVILEDQDRNVSAELEVSLELSSLQLNVLKPRYGFVASEHYASRAIRRALESSTEARALLEDIRRVLSGRVEELADLLAAAAGRLTFMLVPRGLLELPFDFICGDTAAERAKVSVEVVVGVGPLVELRKRLKVDARVVRLENMKIFEVKTTTSPAPPGAGIIRRLFHGHQESRLSRILSMLKRRGVRIEYHLVVVEVLGRDARVKLLRVEPLDSS